MSRTMERYLNHDDPEALLRRHEQQGVLGAYASWGVLEYRATKKSPTHAEKMLKKGLPQPQTLLLRAIMEAHPHDARPLRLRPHSRPAPAHAA